ncbi:DUF7701 domain-containing protein [Nonomuraea guangzhouensis]|uniref:DUF7701 domain-containing protein n=1 Tax=Nonomuraea guangzhouensis TaxID=1291555 RepID=A0ABW4GWH2_9ACTN|nr:hypothetical protein [Nonomuraea guangzhouensis]
MSYVDDVRDSLAARLPGLEPSLLDLYTLLAMTKGVNASMEDVHDAWAVWRSRSSPDHRSIVPFDQLDVDVQELDRKYADAIVEVSSVYWLARARAGIDAEITEELGRG